MIICSTYVCACVVRVWCKANCAFFFFESLDVLIGSKGREVTGKYATCHFSIAKKPPRRNATHRSSSSLGSFLLMTASSLFVNI